MSNNPRHIVQRYYVPVSQSNISGVWSMREEMQGAFDGVWSSSGVIPIINYLAIGGGGSGGNGTRSGTTSNGGGGGAGGLIVGSFGPTYKQPSSIYGYTLTITVGAGGQPIPRIGSTQAGNSGNNGNDTTISGEFFVLGTLIAYGGGTGGGGQQNADSETTGASGGSGGGQGGYSSGDNPILAGASTQGSSTYGGYGNSGGNSSGLGGAAGGGAGSSAAGQTAGDGLFVNVADGSSYSAIYGRGGAPASNRFNVAGSAQGYGSGGNGGFSDYTDPSNQGGPGQNGRIIFWYDSGFPLASSVTGSYTYTIEKGFRIYVFDYPGGTISF